MGYGAPGQKKAAEYTYNATGARVSKEVGGKVERYILDGANVIADYKEDDKVKATYVTPFLDQNLTVQIKDKTYYYIQDGLGSVRNIIDSKEKIQDSYDYYAFGEIISETEDIPNRYKFTGREWDKESQTYYYRARQYNSRQGRFTKIDPLEFVGGLNLYGYVRNNPINFFDPTGLKRAKCDTVISYTQPKWEPVGIYPIKLGQGTSFSAVIFEVGALEVTEMICFWARDLEITWKCPDCCEEKCEIQSNAQYRTSGPVDPKIYNYQVIVEFVKSSIDIGSLIKLFTKGQFDPFENIPIFLSPYFPGVTTFTAYDIDDSQLTSGKQACAASG